jgi:hypothetical protein
MGGIDWSNLTPAVASVVMVGMVALAMFRFVGNHLNHLTGSLERLAEAIVRLREHCAAANADKEEN